jgi:hypothetical protein
VGRCPHVKKADANLQGKKQRWGEQVINIFNFEEIALNWLERDNDEYK